MYTSGELERASMALDEPVNELENRIMSDIVRRIRANGEITSAADWQINRLVQLGMGMAEIQSAISEALGAAEDITDSLFTDVIRAGYVRDSKLYEAVGKIQIPFNDNEPLQQLISSVTAQTNETMNNITQSLGFAQRGTDGRISFTPLADYYQQTLDKAMLDISSGAFDYNTVLHRTVREMTNSGLRTVDYASGHSNRTNVAARRAVMTGMTQLTAKVNEDNAEQLETDWFEISWHSGARPSHWWGGKWYRKDQLRSICKLGDVQGLCGVNCYHDYSPVIPGVSEPKYTDEKLAELNRQEKEPVEYNGKKYTKYEALQRQRRLETTMRAQRQEMALLKEGGASEDDLINCRARYRGTSHEYAVFSKAMGLPQQRERVTVDGLGNIMQGKYTKGSGKPSPVSVPKVGAKREGKVTAEERKELLSRDKVNLKNEESYQLKGSANIAFDKLDGSKAISEKLAEEYREEYDKFTEIFGELSSLNGIDISPYADDGVYGQYYPESRRIVIYGVGGKSGDKFILQSAQEHKASGEWSTGSKYHSFRHELGHALQKEHSISDTDWNVKRSKIEQIFQSLQNELTDLTSHDIIEFKRKKLSLYGFSNVDEFISESVAEYFQNPKKARSTAKNVVSIILGEV